MTVPALEPATAEVHYRGTLFKLVEQDTATYDECLQAATTEDWETGVKVENIDEQMLIRLLLQKALVEPKLTMAEIHKLGVRLSRQLERDCRTLHLGVEPEDDGKKKRGRKAKPEPEPEEDEEEGKADA